MLGECLSKEPGWELQHGAREVDVLGDAVDQVFVPDKLLEDPQVREEKARLEPVKPYKDRVLASSRTKPVSSYGCWLGRASFVRQKCARGVFRLSLSPRRTVILG